MNNQTKIRVLVVDDHPIVRAGLGAVISYQEDMDLVGAAANSTEAIGLFECASPDVVLVDLSLPDLSGIELIEILRLKSSTARLLVLTSNAGRNLISKALQAGANAYLLKSAPSEELLNAIRTVSCIDRYLSPEAGRTASSSANHPELTLRELEVLHWMARGHSNLQIGRELGVTEETVKFHVKNILGKLGVESRSKAVALSLMTGLLQSQDIQH